MTWPPAPRPAPAYIDLSLSVQVRCAAAAAESTMLLQGVLQAAGAAVHGNSEEVKCPAGSGSTLVTAALATMRVGIRSTAALWYPNGYGEQPLHQLTVSLCTAASGGRTCSAAQSSHC